MVQEREKNEGEALPLRRRADAVGEHTSIEPNQSDHNRSKSITERFKQVLLRWPTDCHEPFE